ncbi:MAG: hypothetical protein ABMB14_08500 [Myxococcota bacterium]
MAGEPQITEIASYLATAIPTDGVDPAEATEAWRSSLRYARKTGAIGEVTELIEGAQPEDETLRAHCEALRQPATAPTSGDAPSGS